ncbi:hypothetical protein HOC99_04640 [Candidatus Woesearchaeota archaeon]|nr:hypothetical protein [Candidatus Woesearchaeota archaeon]MBT4387051.1 hypothetical protein [Candidatus Woesearchaeota archaeon]MBT4596192.1 hypothetical protein [Candidatus Woesearchaeota archaeon]MBT5741585.1 hypothetical protein [Candidatus Woesearchaeota archaeon]MBT7296795.1 hypothetical protein [Candidatus Woesearchaeota archaeon]
MMEDIDLNKKVKLLYTNYRGETSIRNIIPKKIVFISNEWHKEEQWCILAYDLNKQADRTFACKDIKKWY